MYNCFFNGPFEYGDGRIFKLLRWMQNLHQSTWDHKMLYTNIFRGWTSCNKITFAIIQNMNMAFGWKLKFTFYFMDSTHEPLHLDKWSLVHWKVMDIPTRFIRIVIFLTELLNMAAFRNCEVLCWDKLHCVECCNFVKCHIFVSYLSCYCFIKGVLNITDTITAAEKYSRLHRPWAKESRLWVRSLNATFY
jgi:hypothetical protein